jgi:Na+-driven multidrug efflux pump
VRIGSTADCISMHLFFASESKPITRSFSPTAPAGSGMPQIIFQWFVSFLTSFGRGYLQGRRRVYGCNLAMYLSTWIGVLGFGVLLGFVLKEVVQMRIALLEMQSDEDQ